MNLASLYQVYLDHPEVTTDSRNIQLGSIFFALKGDNFNGNEFAMTALSKGAAYAIVDEAAYATDDKILLVEDVLTTLQSLARLHRQKAGIPVLAITGTNGKTTTKELTASVLSQKFNLVCTSGNLNNHIGVPLTLLRIRQETEFAVVEMGANHPGEIEALCRIALPDFGLITNVGRAHLEGFGSFEGVVRTKSELYRFLEQNQGTIFINTANSLLMAQAGTVSKIGYTTAKGGDGQEGELVSADPLLLFKVLFPKGWLYVKTRLVGGYNLENALAAATIGHYFGIDPPKIAAALEEYQPDNNRSQMVDTGRNRLLMDAYNANPSSTKAALENFSHLKFLRKGVILGDMLELGPDANVEHQKIVDFLATLDLDLVLLTGSHYAGCKRPATFHCYNEPAELVAYLKETQLSEYLLLIKGSRGMKLETIRPEL